MTTTKLLLILSFSMLSNLIGAGVGLANPRVVANAFQILEVPCAKGTAPTGCYEARNACRAPEKSHVQLPAAGDKWFVAQAGMAASNLCRANRKHCPVTQIAEHCCATQCVTIVGLRGGSDPVNKCMQACTALQ